MATAQSAGPFVELGTESFGHWHFPGDAPVARLHGPRWHRAVRDMLCHPVVKGMLFAVEMMIRQAEWSVEPAADGGSQAQDLADFVESCMHDLDMPWEDALASTLLFLPYGASIFELTYKRRLGQDADVPSASDDGRIGWATWGWRPPETILEFRRDPDTQRIASIVQDVRGRPVEIPMDRCLHFKAGGAAAGPHGESILRAAFASWDAIVKFEYIEAVGMERELAGMPVALVPARFLNPKTDDDRATVDLVQKMLKDVRSGKGSGVVFPLEYDDKGHALWEFKLLASGGARQFNTSDVINRRTAQMTMAMLADFLMLGHQTSGSYALSTDKTKMFETAITSWLDYLADVVNHQGVIRLLRLNGMDLRLAPKLVPGSLAEADLGATAAAFTALWPAIQTLDREDQLAVYNHVATEFGWPEAVNTEAEEDQPQPPTAEETAAQGIAPQGEPGARGPQDGAPANAAPADAPAGTGGATNG